MNFPQFLPSFRHGVHPDEHKERTEHLEIERMPFVELYTIPLNQHIGAPSHPIVRAGQRVKRGEMIAKPGGFVSTAQHSPVTGTVRDVDYRRHPSGEMSLAIEIEADPYDDQLPPSKPPIDWANLTRDEFVKHVQNAGIVGLGGAAFPSHVKYALPEGKVCEWLVLNGSECEPYLTCDHRLMTEAPERILRGIEILRHHLGAKGVMIGIESNKPSAIEALREEISKRGSDVQVKPLQVKYPQGAEKMMIKSIFGREVPAGKLPLDLGMVVNNVATMASIADYFDRGIPLIERVVTVSGPGISKPANLIVPIGTPVRAVLEHCGFDPESHDVVMGGPMMGRALTSLDVPVMKGTSGLLAFYEPESYKRPEYTCIRCGRCLEACPYFLNPSRFARHARARLYEELKDEYLMDCVECGSCTFACPSNIPIVQLIRTAKSAIRSQQKGKK